MDHQRPKRIPARPRGPRTDWSEVATWYDQLVGDEGSEFQRQVIFPGVLRLLGPQPADEVIDVACGQGAFCRLLHERSARASGVDAAPQLIKLARQRSDPAIQYHIGDAHKLDFLPAGHFAAASCILAIQNIDSLPSVFAGVSRLLAPAGRFVMVMMHPCFRGPHYSSWGWDEQAGAQYRRIDRYLLPRKEPIFTHPGKKTGQYTWTFHRPLHMYVKSLHNAGLLVDALEEWPSHKISTSGPRAPAENTARKEIPMFLALRAVKAVAPQTTMPDLRKYPRQDSNLRPPV
jgi:ubiquinone/menaquinone biosynthesis C-methylase UbiE